MVIGDTKNQDNEIAWIVQDLIIEYKIIIKTPRKELSVLQLLLLRSEILACKNVIHTKIFPY